MGLKGISQRRLKIWNTPRNDPKYCDTSIELALQGYLRKIGVPFKTQYPITGIPDIFIEPNIAVFADGCFWHKCPVCGYGKRGRYIDRKVTKILQDKGYIVLRFWEHEINSNLKSCIKKITEVM